jgi:NitT/TauT family transport system permease protein
MTKVVTRGDTPGPDSALMSAHERADSDAQGGEARALSSGDTPIPSSRRSRSERIPQWMYTTVAIIIVLAAWELMARLDVMADYLLPTFTDVVDTAVTEFVPSLPDIWASTKSILLGFGLSIAVGIPLAIVIVASRVVDHMVYPLIVIFQMVPKVSIAPLIIVWAGFGLQSNVLIVFLIAFFPIVINAISGLRSIEVQKLYLLRSMGASSLQTYSKLRLPHALPYIFAGLKLSSTLAVIGAVVAEFIASERGLGRLILNASSNFQTSLLFAGIVYLTVLGTLLFFAIELLERVALSKRAHARIAR